MPRCGCFNQFNISSNKDGTCEFEVRLEGDHDVTRLDIIRVIESAGLASVASVSQDKSIGNLIIRLSGVTDVKQLEVFYNYLKSTIIVDLKSFIDHCYALGPYSLFPNGCSIRSHIGELINQAKYHKDDEASEDLANQLLEFIDSHPILSRSAAIAVPPKWEANSPNLPLDWAKFIAKEMGWRLLTPRKIRQTSYQKDIPESETEDAMVARIRDSMTVAPPWQGSRVLILDDTIGSGGTLLELGRAVRQAGAAGVYGLSAAKDAKFANGGINLDRSVWP